MEENPNIIPDDILDDSVEMSYEEELRIEDEYIERMLEARSYERSLNEDEDAISEERVLEERSLEEPSERSLESRSLDEDEIFIPADDEVEEVFMMDDEEEEETIDPETVFSIERTNDENSEGLSGVLDPADVLDLESIVQEPLPDAEYYKEADEKHQIYLHHTASSGSPYSAINWWKKKPVRVATFIVIAGKPNRSTSPYKDGQMFQCYSSKYWAHHLGLHGRGNRLTGNLAQYKNSTHNRLLNKRSVAIEIASWGQLTYKNGKYYSYANTEVPSSDVVTYDKPYRGFKHYHKYSDAQIESLRKLLLYLCNEYKIPTDYQGDEIWDLSEKAVRGDKGIFTHTSVRSDKFDCHPQPELIEMLKSLSGSLA